MKAKHCEICRHAEWVGDNKLVCNKGHKPRFFKPTVIGPHYADDDYGWKRRCGDYQPERDRTVYIGLGG